MIDVLEKFIVFTIAAVYLSACIAVGAQVFPAQYCCDGSCAEVVEF